MAHSFLQALASDTPLLADGAMGTMLQTMGLPVGDAPERWNFERPDDVREVARLYAAAGAVIVFTNTFGANRVRTARFGLADRIVDLNRRAVELARGGVEAANRKSFVVGSIGPTGELLEPYGELGAETAWEAFTEQATALTAAGVDAIACESFTDLQEALLCVQAMRAVTDAPLLASMSFETNDRTMMGVRPEDVVTQLADAGAAVVGANCSVGPEVVTRMVRAMKAARPSVPLLAKSNAGAPQVAAGKTVYLVTPEMMAAFAVQMRQLGVAIIGGCCGTTPLHIAAMATALDNTAEKRRITM